jgi:hypothetical protein
MSRTVVKDRGRWSELLRQERAEIVRFDLTSIVDGECVVFDRMYYKA